MIGFFNIPHRDALGTYLGWPICQGSPSKATFQEIISIATSKLKGWKTNYLFNFGKTILIQSQLESLPAYTKQCF